MSVEDSSPLNLAHQQGRHADRLLTAGRYHDAIVCHEKAADHLLRAMKMTSVPQALTSLQLQYKFHFKQRDIIREKHRRAESYRKYQEQREKEAQKKAQAAKELQELREAEELLQKTLASNTERDSEVESEPDEEENGIDSNDETDLSRGNEKSVIHDGEPDSLLQFLNKGGRRDKFSSSVHAATKAPKNAEEKMEELKTSNAQLQEHVSSLLQELEKTKHELHAARSENRQLRRTVDILTTQIERYVAEDRRRAGQDLSVSIRPAFSASDSSFDEQISPPSEIPPLAPLEIPDFDFDSFK
ncbi:PREDICTED: nuclear receptor-binding factor 2-like [Branchiostoma belcheri]|uniref:Nuclear receptor-binding factor 2-like n=1 Tax=Branchiostoma belcheri TaxID=7741 RepID=A0A6P4YXC8_BRABE|nr:PREDICTED: nuclear receptor-binding factor 2-like [Branchiostoma belcheri]